MFVVDLKSGNTTSVAILLGAHLSQHYEVQVGGGGVLTICKREQISVLVVCKKAHKNKQMHFMAVKKLRKFSGFVIYSYSSF